jgi:uncharacterized membrane protein
MDPFTMIVVLVVSLALSMALAPKPPKPAPASIQDFDVPTAEEGRPIPVVFGTVLITGPNVIWYGDLRTSPIKTKSGK